jgi:hypothetical protein
MKALEYSIMLLSPKWEGQWAEKYQLRTKVACSAGHHGGGARLTRHHREWLCAPAPLTKQALLEESALVFFKAGVGGGGGWYVSSRGQHLAVDFALPLDGVRIRSDDSSDPLLDQRRSITSMRPPW